MECKVFNIFKTISICNFRAFLNGTNVFDFFCDSYCSCFLWLILFLLVKGLKNGAFFIFYFFNFVPWISWEQSRTRIVVFDFPSQIARLTKFMFLSYCPRGSWPSRLQIPESPISPKWVIRVANWLTLTVCSCHVTYAFVSGQFGQMVECSFKN